MIARECVAHDGGIELHGRGSQWGWAERDKAATFDSLADAEAARRRMPVTGSTTFVVGPVAEVVPSPSEVLPPIIIVDGDRVWQADTGPEVEVIDLGYLQDLEWASDKDEVAHALVRLQDILERKDIAVGDHAMLKEEHTILGEHLVGLMLEQARGLMLEQARAEIDKRKEAQT
jgi:hypothetical protein